MREILIGTGFYATPETYEANKTFFNTWWHNKKRYRWDVNIHVADCSEPNCGLYPDDVPMTRLGHLGYTGGGNTIRGNRIMGWSMSWIVPALVAYSENCDYIYKEQDCLAFGDWIPVVRGDGKGFHCGRHSQTASEQSLFFLERDFIPDFISAYLSFKQNDLEILPESKGPAAARLCGITDPFFDMPFGRDRPLTIYTDRPWYAQRFTFDELMQCKEAGLL